MNLPEEVADLVAEFAANRSFFAGQGFKEYQVRTKFLSPVLAHLGWDVKNTGLAPADWMVIEEDKLRIADAGKAPDYAFLIDRKRKFYLEAKRPSVNIGVKRDPAYQIRRYSWNAGHAVGLVTDFEEWAVYDGRYPPSLGDEPRVGRLKYFTFDELEEKWDWLASTFGRAAVASGSLEAFVGGHVRPKGTSTIDQTFLDEIREWRVVLAFDISTRNLGLGAAALNRAVQNLIDRIVFLRIAEARGLEPPEDLLRAADEKPGVYSRLVALFLRADTLYNSGLFRFATANTDSLPPDRTALGLLVGDGVLRKIITRLYYPHPYEFSVMPADILGRVYEQFLGEAITMAGVKAVVEEKPETRKAGGVYYTPQPIVDYIVEETLGPLLRGASPKDAAAIKIVDPACGSGSFLIVAYQYLLDWHTNHYAGAPRLAKKFLEAGPDGNPRLRTAERKRILINSIYGVDIDPQAVEVTKLSLLLKVIEGQTEMELEVGRLLPNLDANIRCGNSLIDVDFSMPLDLDEDSRLVVNPFSWKNEFPQVLEHGKFTAVIGNPPYLSIDATWGKKDPRLSYIKSAYHQIHTDKTDILFYFLKRAVDICDGEIGYIVSRSFLEANKAQKLRGWLAGHCRVREILDFRHAAVFPGVGINTAIVRITGSRAVKKTEIARYRGSALPPGYTAAHLREESSCERFTVSADDLGSDSWSFGQPVVTALLSKIDAAGTPVGEILHIGQGMQTGHNKAFDFKPESEELRLSMLDEGTLLARARNSDIGHFDVAPPSVYVIFPENHETFESLPQAARIHLQRYEPELKARAAYKRGDCLWWRYTWPLHKEYLSQPRILCPYRSKENRFAVDRAASYIGLTDTTVLYEKGQPEDLAYIAAVLNSSVASFRFRYIGKLVGGGTYEYFHNTVRRLPIPRRGPGDPLHDRIVGLYQGGRTLAENLRSTRVPEEISGIEGDLSQLKLTLDETVSDLFGLTAPERQRLNQGM